jgi:hypothetical protein
MNIGSLEIQLMADMATLRKDMDDAKSTVGGAMKDIEAAVGLAKTAFAALAGVASVNAFAGMIASTIEAQGALQDLATKTGATAAALNEFRTVGLGSETSIDAVAGAMNKLSKSMATTSADSGGAAVAIKALGLDFNTIKQMAPEQQMMEVAKAMSGFADGSDKSAAAMKLFGKAGADLLPFLKDLAASSGEVTAALTEQEIAYRKTQAAMADAFGDNLALIKREADSWKRDLAEGMTPALYELSQAFLDVVKETGGFKDTITELSRDGSITEWTRGAITGLTYLMDVFSGLGAVVKSSGEIIGAMMAQTVEKVTSAATALGQVASGEFSAAFKTMEDSATRQKAIAEDLAATLDKTWGAQTLGSQLRDRMAELEGVGVATDSVGKKNLEYSKAQDAITAAAKAHTQALKDAAAAAKELERESAKQEQTYNKITAAIGAKVAAMDLEVANGTKLTAMEKLEIEFLDDIRTGTKKLSEEQTIAAMAKFEAAKASEALYIAYNDEKKILAESNKEMASMVDHLSKRTEHLTQELEKQTLLNLEMTYGKEAMSELTTESMRNNAASLERQAQLYEESGISGLLVDGWKEQAKVLRELADAKDQGTHLKMAREAAAEWEKITKSMGTGLSNTIVDAIVAGRDPWVAFRDFMVKTIVDGVLKKALADVITNGLNSLISGVTGLNVGGALNTAGTVVNGGSNAITAGGLVSGAGSALGITANSAGGGLGFTGGGLTGALGINATAGGGATTAAVVGGNGATGVIATDLGLLGDVGATTAATTGVTAGGAALAAEFGALGNLGGSAAGAMAATDAALLAEISGAGVTGGAAATAGASTGAAATAGASTGAFGGGLAGAAGVAAVMVGGVYVGSQIMNALMGMSNGPAYDVVGSGSFPYSGNVPTGTSFWDGDTVYKDVNSVDYEVLKSRENGALAYQLSTGGTVIGMVDELTKKAIDEQFPDPEPVSTSVGWFASGGDFAGGLRIVGENGPELEATGPSRIFDANATASMLRSGGANSDEVVAELRLLRLALEANAANTNKTNKTLDRIAPGGDAMSVRVVT